MDLKAEKGRASFTKCLCTEEYLLIKPSRIENMMYIYVDQGSHRNVVVDVPRRVESDHYEALYDFVESVKDRQIRSTKYRPISHTELNNVHVILMANRLPDYQKIFEDRIKLIYC